MKMTNDIAYFCGLWIAEGSFEESIGRVTITCGDDDVGHVLESGAVFGVEFKKRRKDQWSANSHALLEAMRFLKMPLVKAPEKWLPDWVWSGKREWACELLAGILDGDGYCSTVRNKIGFTTASERLAKDIHLLLTNLGMVARLTSVKSKPTEKVKVSSLQYRVELVGENVSIFKHTIKPRIKRKAEALAAMPDDVRTRSGLPCALPHLLSIKSVFEGVKMPKLAAAIQTARKGSDLTYRTILEVLEECQFAEATVGWQALKKLTEEGYFWDEVTSVDDGECETFDFTIPDTHSFWSNGFISHNTPKAYNFLYELYMIGQKESNRREGKWCSWQFPTMTSPFIPPEEIEAAREDMDEKSFNQEFNASFETMSGRVYHCFDRRVHVKPCPFDPKKPILIGQDFNIDPMSSVIAQQQDNGDVWIVDEIVLKGSNTEETCNEIERRYWRYMDNIYLFPDPASNYRQHARGETDLDIFREKGITKHRFRAKHPPIADRVNAVNRMLRSANGTVRLYIDPKCKYLIASLEQTIYKPGSRDIDKEAGVEHSADALGYYIEYTFPVRKVKIAGVSI
jgi:hypothetical protein